MVKTWEITLFVGNARILARDGIPKVLIAEGGAPYKPLA